MPGRKSKQLPSASKRKRFLHALYLAQPFLQFMILMVVFFVLGRCSPLSPSTERSLNKISSDGVVGTRTEKGESAAEEEDIRNALHEISDNDELPLLTDATFKNLVAESVRAEESADGAAVASLFQRYARQRMGAHQVKLLSINLTADQRAQFFQGTAVRLNVAERLSAVMKPEIRKGFLSELRKISRLQGQAYLVLADDAAQDIELTSNLKIRSKLQLGFLSDEKVFLQIRKVEQALDEEQQKLIDLNQKKALFLAVVLE